MMRQRERWGHAIGEFGNNLVYNFFNGYLLLFYTDVMGLSAGFTGILFLVSRIIVAVSDPVVGIMADRTNTKFGHYRIWLLAASPVVAVFLVLSFLSPFSSLSIKYVYSFITFLVLGISFTATDVPFWTLPSVMTDDPVEKASIFSLSGLVSTISGGLAGFMVPLILSRSIDLSRTYFLIAVCFALIMISGYYYCAFTVKERVIARNQNVTLGKSLKAIGQNRPLMIAAIGGLLVYTGFFLRNSSSSFYGIYVLGGYGSVSIITLMLLIGRLIGSAIAPHISKRIGTRNALVVALLYGIAVSTIYYFTGYENKELVYFLTAVSAISNGAFIVLFFSLIGETIDYGEYRFSIRNDGMITSFRTFVTKAGSAIAGSFLAFYLAAINYIPNTDQTVETKNMLHLMISLIPSLLYLGGIVFFLIYPISKSRLDEIEAELKIRRGENA